MAHIEVLPKNETEKCSQYCGTLEGNIVIAYFTDVPVQGLSPHLLPHPNSISFQ